MANERGNKSLKLLDRYVGIPLIWMLLLGRPALRWIRRGRARPAQHDRMSIGLLATGAIGDLILASGVIQDLRVCFPAAELILFVSKTNASAATLIPDIDRTVELAITRPWDALAVIRQHRLDWLLDLGPWPRINALLCALCSAQRTVGFAAPRQYRHPLYDYVIKHRSDLHQLDNLRNLLSPLEVQAVCPPAVRFDRLAPPDLPAKFAVFHAWPGGYRCQYKRWPNAAWVSLGNQVQSTGLPIVLTGGPGDIQLSDELEQQMRAGGVRVMNTAGRFNLPEAAALLRRASVVVSVDTGIMHLAAAAGAPVVGLHGPTASSRWGAVGKQIISINSGGKGSGYLDLGFEYPKNPPDSMGRISPDTVFDAVQKLLGRAAPDSEAADQPMAAVRPLRGAS